MLAMLRIIAILFGIAFIFAGVAGFMPMFMQDGLLFGYFMVDSLHNLVHIVTGVIAIMAATSYRLTRGFFKIFGVIYFIVAIWGFWTGDLILIHVNTADNILHLVVGLIAIYLGFSKSARA
jgi:hypothetical protein